MISFSRFLSRIGVFESFFAFPIPSEILALSLIKFSIFSSIRFISSLSGFIDFMCFCYFGLQIRPFSIRLLLHLFYFKFAF